MNAIFDPNAEFDREAVRARFEAGVLPDLKRFGPEMGERAMQGDVLAEGVIRRYAIYAAWEDPVNLGMLEWQTRNWLKRREELKR
jgi:hypothetical protein